MRQTVLAVIGVVAGAAVWMLAFFAEVAVLAAAWPAFREPGRIWQTEFVFTFTTPMASMLLLCWLLAAIAAGWTAAKIGRQGWAVWVLAGLVGIYLFAMHIVLYWATFPWWYNLGVVVPAVPAILVGARLANRRREAAGA
jgi:hypothetical protein